MPRSPSSNRAAPAIAAILHAGATIAVVVVVGPCSIHDHDQAIEYGGCALKAWSPMSCVATCSSSCARISRSRAPPSAGRATSTTHISTAASRSTEGLERARRLLVELTMLGDAYRHRVPRPAEPPVHRRASWAWGAIGARTTESQSHRQLASGLSCTRSASRTAPQGQHPGRRRRRSSRRRRAARRLRGHDEDRAWPRSLRRAATTPATSSCTGR